MGKAEMDTGTGREGGEQELAALLAREQIAQGDDLHSEVFPRLWTVSAGFFYQFIPQPLEKKPPEYVYVEIPTVTRGSDNLSIRTRLQVMKWNLAWEAGHLRHDLFGEGLPIGLQWLERFAQHNIYLVPRHAWHRYDAYSPLFHLLPHDTLTRFALPALRMGVWPGGLRGGSEDFLLPNDFDVRLSQAFAHHLWPLLNSRSPMSAFSSSDSIRVLAHNLDYWLPHAAAVIESRLRTFPRCLFEDDDQASLLEQIREQSPPDGQVNRPLMGGDVWSGEEDAWQATRDMVGHADSTGQLRAVIDAIRSNRVEDDFSERWSYEREDFERKLYHKRSKVKVCFVELRDTIPVHGPESEVHDNLIWEDFLALLDEKERRVVVCIRSGVTRVGEISEMLGYANHSPVSKALARIRRKALEYLDS